MANDYSFSIPSSSPQPSYSFSVGDSTPAVAANPTPAPDFGSFAGGIPDDILQGIKSVVGDFVSGAKSAYDFSANAAPAVSSVKDFYLGGGAEHALDVGANALGATLQDSADRAVNAWQTVMNPDTTGLQKGVSIGEAGIGALNALFTPITSTLSTVSTIPGVGRIADAFNNIFAAIGGGASEVASHAVDNSPLSPDVKNEIKPLVSEASALVSQILAGEAGGEAMGRVSDLTHTIASKTADAIQNMPPDTYQRGFIRNPFSFDPESPEAKTEIEQLAAEKDPAQISSTLQEMGVSSDVAEAFAPKIAEAADPKQISDLLQIAKGSQNLIDQGHVETSVGEGTQAPPSDLMKNEGEVAPGMKINDTVPRPQETMPPQFEPLAAEVRKFASYSDLADALGKQKEDLQAKIEAKPGDPELIREMQALNDKIGQATPAFYAKAIATAPTAESPRGAGLGQARPGEDAGRSSPTQSDRTSMPADQNKGGSSEKTPSKGATPADFLKSLPKDEVASLKPIIQEVASNARGKVHILDYLATPEFVLEKIGLGKWAKMLHDAYDSYRTTLKKEIVKIEDWKARVDDVPGSARSIFQYLDGQERTNMPLMTDEEVAVAREIRAYLKDWAARLELPQHNQISRYITHIFEPDFIQKDFDPDLARIMAGETAGSVYDPFLQKRMGKQGYVQDVWAALDAYVKRATRKEAMDPPLEGMKKAAERIDEQSYNYVQKLSHRINMRPTEFEKLVDNWIKSSFIGYKYGERPIAYLSNKIRGLFYRGTLGLNFTSAIRNLTQGVNTYAKLGERYTVVGYSRLVYKLMSKDMSELYDSHILDDQFVQNKRIGVYKSMLQKADPVLYSLFETTEMINRGAAYFGAKAKALNEGKTEPQAIDAAKRLVRETQFAFGSIDTPVALNDDAIKTLTQLQTFNIKQIEFLARMAKNKEFGGLIRFTVGSVLVLNTIGKIFGMTVQQLIPTVGIGGSPIGTLASNLAGLASTNAQQKATAVTGLKNQAWTLMPAGAQIRKTIQGLEAYNAGKDVTPTGKTRYEIPHNWQNLLQASLFGKSALPQAQTYYNKINGGAKPKPGKNTYGF